MPVGLANVNIERLVQMSSFSSRVLPMRLNQTLGQREHGDLKKWSVRLGYYEYSRFPSNHRAR
jgi:hypothetical protein